MSAMSRQKKMLAFTILCTALVQMSFFGLTPAISKIQNEVFTGYSLAQIQTVITMPTIISMAISLISAFLIGKNIITKKGVVILGLFLLSVPGFLSLLFNTRFWHLIMLSIAVGTGLGLFIPNITSILFDNYDASERRVLTGLQSTFISIGGIIISLISGYLITVVWYGGYLTMLLSLPVFILAAITIPKDIRHEKAQNERKTKMPAAVYFYAAACGLFLLLYMVCSNNISTHLSNSGIGNSATAGLLVALTMVGGALSGIFFNRMSKLFKDYLIAMSFLMLFVGYTILNIGHSSLALIILGSIIIETSMNMITPQCLFSISNIVDPSISATATSLVVSIAPGIGSFISPVIITNITTMLGGASTNFRYQFTGIVALIFGLILLYVFRQIERKAKV